jgi:hypothetical protein
MYWSDERNKCQNDSRWCCLQVGQVLHSCKQFELVIARDSTDQKGFHDMLLQGMFVSRFHDMLHDMFVYRYLSGLRRVQGTFHDMFHDMFVH